MDEHTLSNESTSRRILSRIREGEVRMRPKWHFVLRTLLITTGGIMVGMLTLYVVSFAVFVLRQTGVAYIPALGFAGAFRFILSLPWVLVLLALLFVGILEVLVRKYSFAYRRPLLYSLAVVLAVVSAGSYVVSASSLHGRLMEAAVQERLPVAGKVYRALGREQVRNVHPGTVLEVTTSGVVVENHRGEELNIIVGEHTRRPRGQELIPGDRIVIMGSRASHSIEADGIIRADGGWPTPKPQMREGMMLRQMKYRRR
jgi:hypothetical protein